MYECGVYVREREREGQRDRDRGNEIINDLD